MNDKRFPILQYAILFALCYVTFKTINILDSCVRTYLARKHHVYVDDYPTMPLDKFFADEDWD